MQASLSIVVPTFNAANTLAATLKSIVSQNFSRAECWIIDGQSSDETIQIATDFSAAYPFIQFITEPDKGIYDAMNKGIRLAKNDYLFFMGSDDVFCNENVLNDLFSLPDFGVDDFIYGDIIFKHSGIRQGEEKNYLKLIKNLENINHQSIFYSKKVFELLGEYDLKYPIYADYNFNIRCFRDQRLSKKYINKPVCIFNEKGTSFFYRSRDRYIEEVHTMYVNGYEDPVVLYDTVRHLEGQVANLLNSKDYVLGKKIGDTVRKLRRLVPFKLLNGR